MKLGITGYPLLYTQSPALHRRFLRQSGIKGTYEVFPFDPSAGKAAFFKFLDEKKNQNFRGLNVTIPLKEWAFDYAKQRGAGVTKDRHGLCAGRVGAANTLVFGARGVRCANTDAAGFWDDVEEWFSTKQQRLSEGYDLVILGTGGAARGVIAGMLSGNVKNPMIRQLRAVRVCGRNPRKVTALRRLLPAKLKVSAPSESSRPLLVVWCLPPLNQVEGRKLLRNVLPGTSIKDFYLYDMNYGERATVTKGLVPRSRWRSGLGMLRKQARESFDLWRA